MFCVKCGSSLTDGVKFCPQCGAAVQVEPEAQTGTETQSSHDSPINRGESTGVLRWLKILFWGSLVCGALSDIISTKPFWSASSDFIWFVFSNIAFVLLTVYVLRGAKWARISCYIIGALLLCMLGTEAVEDVPFGTWKEGGTISFLLSLIDVFGFIVGSVMLLVTNPLKTFEGCKAQPKNGWMVCLVFWMLFLGGVALSCCLEDKEPELSTDEDEERYLFHLFLKAWSKDMMSCDDLYNGNIRWLTWGKSRIDLAEIREYWFAMTYRCDSDICSGVDRSSGSIDDADFKLNCQRWLLAKERTKHDYIHFNLEIYYFIKGSNQRFRLENGWKAKTAEEIDAAVRECREYKEIFEKLVSRARQN